MEANVGRSPSSLRNKMDPSSLMGDFWLWSGFCLDQLSCCPTSTKIQPLIHSEDRTRVRLQSRP